MSNTIYWDKLRILVTNSCNYRCPFCHNEGQVSRKTIKTMDFDKFKILIDAVRMREFLKFALVEVNPSLIKTSLR